MTVRSSSGGRSVVVVVRRMTAFHIIVSSTIHFLTFHISHFTIIISVRGAHSCKLHIYQGGFWWFHFTKCRASCEYVIFVILSFCHFVVSQSTFTVAQLHSCTVAQLNNFILDVLVLALVLSTRYNDD